MSRKGISRLLDGVVGYRGIRVLQIYAIFIVSKDIVPGNNSLRVFQKETSVTIIADNAV